MLLSGFSALCNSQNLSLSYFQLLDRTQGSNEEKKKQVIPGGSESLSLSALSLSVTHSVYRYLEHLTLNFVTSPDFFILTDLASFRLAVSKKSLISLICFGCTRCTSQKQSQHQSPHLLIWRTLTNTLHCPSYLVSLPRHSPDIAFIITAKCRSPCMVISSQDSPHKHNLKTPKSHDRHASPQRPQLLLQMFGQRNVLLTSMHTSPIWQVKASGNCSLWKYPSMAQ